MKCIKCGTEISKSDKFCFNCGTKQSEANVCPKCKKTNDVNAKFCISCGNKLNEEPVSKVSKREATTSTGNKKEDQKKNVTQKSSLDSDKIYKMKNSTMDKIESILVEDDVIVYGPEFV